MTENPICIKATVLKAATSCFVNESFFAFPGAWPRRFWEDFTSSLTNIAVAIEMRVYEQNIKLFQQFVLPPTMPKTEIWRDDFSEKGL